MKRECAECLKELDERRFDEGMDVCRKCALKMEEEAVAYAVKMEGIAQNTQKTKKALSERSNDVLAEERRELQKDVEDQRNAERQKAPPREYPYPWRRSR